MRKIELLTVDKKYVATVEIPGFQKAPEVVVWGDRTFVHDGDDHRYVEAFAVVSVTPSPGLDRWYTKCQFEGCHNRTKEGAERCAEHPKNPPPVDRNAKTTLHGTPMGEHLVIDKATGMQKDYVVLSEDERKKGFVRPVRRSYKHVGIAAPKRLRDLTADETERFDTYGYVKFESDADNPEEGRYWTKTDLNRVGKGCNSVTTMSTALAETYARDPHFYGSTYCATCRAHFPVGEVGEFVWDGTDERVGT